MEVSTIGWVVSHPPAIKYGTGGTMRTTPDCYVIMVEGWTSIGGELGFVTPATAGHEPGQINNWQYVEIYVQSEKYP